MNTMGMITIAKFLEEHNASVNLMNLFEAMCSDFIKLQQETNAAQEKNIEAQHSGGVASKCGTANKSSLTCLCELERLSGLGRNILEINEDCPQHGQHFDG